MPRPTPTSWRSPDGALLRSRTIDAGCRLFEQAIEVCEADELAFHLPAAHAVLGLWPVWSGRLDRTRRHARRGCELARQVGRPGWEAVGLTGLGAADVLQGDHGQAQDWLSKAQAVLRGPGLEGTEYDMFVRPWLALSAYASGDLETARATAAEIVRIGRGRGSRWDESIGEWLLGVLAHGQERHDEARAHLEASRALSTDPRLPFPLGRSLLGLAELAKEDEDLDEAWELAHDSLEVLDDYGDRVGAAAALETIADLAVALGEPERSLRLLAASQRFHTDTGIARFPFQADRFDRARDAAQAALDPTDATACWDAGQRAVAGRRGRLCPPRAGRASTPADRLGVTDSRRTRRRAAGRRRPHQRRDRSTPVHLRQHGQEAPVPRLHQGGRRRTRGSRRTGRPPRPVVPPLTAETYPVG